MFRAAKALLLLGAILACSCSPSGEGDKRAAAVRAAAAAFPPPPHVADLPAELRQVVDQTFTGDLDGMLKRQLVRVGAPFNRTFYFVDDGVQRGLSYEYAQLFEDELNRQLPQGHLRVHVILLPMPRDMLIPQLTAGRIDMIAAQLTDTPERRRLVDFTNPTRPKVDEVLVSSPSAPLIRSLDDLQDTPVYVRRSSSYWTSLQDYNRAAKAQGRAQIAVRAAPESLEDDDLLEMVNAGLIPATVVDNYLATFWKQVFPRLIVHDALALRRGGALAVAIRKDSPQLRARLDAFIAGAGLDTAVGRVLSKRYLQGASYVKDAASVQERRKFLRLAELFRKYGEQYDFDYLLMAAQAYQESDLDQNARRRAGGVGVMQLTAAAGKEQDVGDIRQLEPNIHAGVKYMRFMRDQYFEGEPMDALNKALFTFASYDAGPGRINALRREARARGLDPNIWFGNVERVASERIGRETVAYVSAIYKYYIAYQLAAIRPGHGRQPGRPRPSRPGAEVLGTSPRMTMRGRSAP